MLLSKTLRSSTLRLALIYVGVFSTAIFAVLGYVYWETVSYVDGMAGRVLATERAVLLDAWREGGAERLAALIRQRTADRFFARWAYLLADRDFSHVAGNLHSWPAPFGDSEGAGEIAPADRDGPLRAVWQRLPDGQHLLLARQVDDLRGLVGAIGAGLGGAAGLFLVLATAAGISTARRSVTRIETINATSREIMRSGPGNRIPLRGTGDEWDDLAGNLNTMLDRIEELVEANRQVSDNIAHDLRTPLTRMRGRLERAHNRPPDPEETHALIGDVIAELDGILRTVSSLLRISRIEMRERRAGFRRIDLGELAREVVELFDAAAEEQGAALRIAADGPAVIEGDRDMLFDAVSNLIDNAIKHGGAGGEITVAAGRTGEDVVIRVCDRGPGIPPEERKRVFDRFYRLERSRNAPGNGLGLSLVAAVANLHAARIELADNHPGLAVALHFPAADTTPAGAPEQAALAPPLR